MRPFQNDNNRPSTWFYWGGIFEMNVDFGNMRGSIEMSSSGIDDSISYNSNLSGDFSINLSDATFFGNRLTYERNNFRLGDYNGLATIYGSFHGQEAVGVSGIFYGNNDRKYAGGFIGARRQYTRPRNSNQ